MGNKESDWFSDNHFKRQKIWFWQPQAYDVCTYFCWHEAASIVCPLHFFNEWENWGSLVLNDSCKTSLFRQIRAIHKITHGIWVFITKAQKELMSGTNVIYKWKVESRKWMEKLWFPFRIHTYTHTVVGKFNDYMIILCINRGISLASHSA